MAKKKTIKKTIKKVVNKPSKKRLAEYDSPQAAMDSLNLRLGNGTIYQGTNIVKVESFPTGVPGFDDVLGCGGMPRGRLIEIFGAESSGKTTLTLKIIAAAQKYFAKGNRLGDAAFVDAEHALDPEWARINGVDTSKLIMSQPTTGEDAMDVVDTLIRARVPLIVLDSVAALITKEELEGEIGDKFYAPLARLMSNSCKRIKDRASKFKSTVIFINQIREKVNVQFGNPETTPGGRALKFYASVRAQISAGSALKEVNYDDEPYGKTSNIKIVKNKVASPFRKTESSIFFGKDFQVPETLIGMDTTYSLMMAAITNKVIEVSGSYYKLGGKNIGNGKNKLLSAMLNDEDLYRDINTAFYNSITPDYMKDPNFDPAKDIDRDPVNQEEVDTFNKEEE